MAEFWLQYYCIGSPSDEVRVIFTSHLGQWWDEWLPLTHMIADRRWQSRGDILASWLHWGSASVVWSRGGLPGIYRKWWLRSQNFQLKTAQGGENTMLDRPCTQVRHILSFWLAHGDGRLTGGSRNESGSLNKSGLAIQACCTQAGPAHCRSWRWHGQMPSRGKTVMTVHGSWLQTLEWFLVHDAKHAK